MNKMFAVFKREYLQAVRKKSFIIMTVLLPLLMTAMMLIPGLMMERGMGMKKIAVLDGTGKLRDAFSRPNERPKPGTPKEEARKAMRGNRGPNIPTQLQLEYVDQTGADVAKAAEPYLNRLARSKDDASKLDGVFTIPSNAIETADSQLRYYSRSSTDIMTQERLSRLANRKIQRLRLSANGIEPEMVEDLMQELPIESVQLSRTGEKKTGGELNFILGFLLAAMLLMPTLIYGTETMRGIIQEKNDRVVEVLISSIKPMQLLSGKILGNAAVGLTQIFAWLVMGGIGASFVGAIAAGAGINVSQFFRPMVFVYFFLFFILAYLTFVCVYSIAGAVCNSEKEAQQFIMPVMLLMMMPWILAMPIIMNPDSPIAVGFSLSPVFGPMTMFMRTLATEPPAWHIALTVVISIGTIAGLLWITGKIFRVGILSYGKRPTIPELWRWLKVA